MITQDIQGLEPGEKIELFELDATGIGGDFFRFHGYPTGEIWWQGKEYSAWPIRAEGFARTGEAQQPAPMLSTTLSARNCTVIPHWASIWTQETFPTAIRQPILMRLFPASSGISNRKRRKAMMPSSSSCHPRWTSTGYSCQDARLWRMSAGGCRAAAIADRIAAIRAKPVSTGTTIRSPIPHWTGAADACRPVNAGSANTIRCRSGVSRPPT